MKQREQSCKRDAVMYKLGENLSREWSEDPQGPELWDALQLIKSDTSAGLMRVEQVAEKGSSLAMMFLGHAYLRGRYGLHVNPDLGEHWLRRSAAKGSIEGAFHLARHLLHSGRPDEALIEYRRLADLNYAPALFVLGREYYVGERLEKDTKKALYYFECAEKEGHIYAVHQISHILMRERVNLFMWVRGFAKWLAMIIPFLKTKARYPTSDRIRV